MSKKKKNIILENIKLISAGAKGVAVGKTEEGKTVLVTGAVPGDVVNARVKKAKSKYYEAEVLEVIEKSPYRVEPKCIHFGVWAVANGRIFLMKNSLISRKVKS